ncbi:hypothetical protein [Chitinophaga sp. Cy-1792]|uniref:hypothetical protein n=1 Tax=Chitinophaga sp. Cy-1792 TaxID=2608339 RepID=UPI0014240165|nr:hypothetical protein [Chitinophaga sp. Cy-1792]NIG55129.1 hypothetical protein [Chitinophaga sp. Cy-1792]
MKNLLLVMLIGMAIPYHSVAQASDQLEPFEPSHNAVDSYYNHLYQKVLWRMAEKPLARFVVIPPYSPEYALSVERDQQNNYWLKSNIRVAYYDPAAEKRVTAEKPVVLTKKINEKLALKIQHLFDLALQQRKETMDFGIDGIRYFFSSYDAKDGMVNGQASSPVSSSKTGLLVKICHELISFTKGQNNNEDSLVNNINRLAARYEKPNDIRLSAVFEAPATQK